MLFKQHDNSAPLNSIHYTTLYPQNGDRIVVVGFVTSFHPMYSIGLCLQCVDAVGWAAGRASGL